MSAVALISFGKASDCKHPIFFNIFLGSVTTLTGFIPWGLYTPFKKIKEKRMEK